MRAFGRTALVPLLLLAVATPTAAAAEEALKVKFPQGAREECSAPAIGRFSVEGPGPVTVKISVIPYKSLGVTPNVPVSWGLVRGEGEPSFGPAIPLPGFERVRYTQLGQEVGNWADNVPLVIERFFTLEDSVEHVIEVKGYPQCWMMPQNVYWQEGQELRVEVSGGGKVTVEPGISEDGDGRSPALPGLWSTSEGALTLQQDGARIRGTYDVDDGRIEGTLTGSVLIGYWGEGGSNRRCDTERLGTRYWGRIRWTFTDNSFKGTWGYCDDEPASPWTGNKLEPH